MPYHWKLNSQDGQDTRILELWPHNSLPKQGFAGFILATFILFLLPLLALSGTLLFWGLLPFLMLAIWAVWTALQISYQRNNIHESLSFGQQILHFTRANPKNDTQSWTCEGYWSRVSIYTKEGPVPYYVTLNGNGREVEIGSFLSEEERKSVYEELCHELQKYKTMESKKKVSNLY
ncbi:MAG: hypothetical protein CL532_10720 [Aestuariivita sp.]|nr:hypothetical protein [Aestuariivita sp.]